MYRYRVAHFQNIPGQNIPNQQPLDPETIEQLRLQEERRKRNLSRLKTAGLGLASGALLTQGGINLKRGMDFVGEAVESASDPARAGILKPYNQFEVENILDKGRLGTAGMAIGVGMGLGGLYLAGKTARRIIRGIRNKQNQLAMQNEMQNDPQNSYNQPNAQQQQQYQQQVIRRI